MDIHQQIIQWISDHVPENCMGECQKYATELAEAFPDDLRLVRGYYFCTTWGEREHWYCRDRNNRVYDPTSSQFPTRGVGPYTDWEEGTEEPTGICMDCGDYCYGGNPFCSQRCEIATLAYLNSGRL